MKLCSGVRKVTFISQPSAFRCMCVTVIVAECFLARDQDCFIRLRFFFFYELFFYFIAKHGRILSFYITFVISWWLWNELGMHPEQIKSKLKHIMKDKPLNDTAPPLPIPSLRLDPRLLTASWSFAVRSSLDPRLSGGLEICRVE